MFTATFDDGSTRSFKSIHGLELGSGDGGRYLFEFPDGTIREGTLREAIDEPPTTEGHHSGSGIYDPASRTIAVEV